MKPKAPLAVGCSSTALARAQTEAVVRRLQAAYPRLTCRTVALPPADPNAANTLGGAARNGPAFLAEFPAQIRAADTGLRAGEFRFLVHWAGDLLLPLAEDLVIAAVLERDTPYDAFLNRQALITDDMPAGAEIGVLNLRAKAQMKTLWPQLAIKVLAGGAESALSALMRHSEVDGLVLPAAVTEYLNIQAVVTEIYYPETMLPSCGQGILVLLTRADDEEARELARGVHSAATAAELEAELAFRERMAPDQDVPAGVLAQVEGKRIAIVGTIASPSGRTVERSEREGPFDQASELGAACADELLSSANVLIDLLEADFPDGLPAGEIDSDLEDDALGDPDDEDVADDVSADEPAPQLAPDGKPAKVDEGEPL